jgi:signal transduction histidine kinase
MQKRFRNFFSRFFNPSLEFRVRLFNILAMAGTAISFLVIFANLATRMWTSALVSALSAILSGGLLWYSVKSGRYRLCYVITIIAVFLILFPILFFTSGGYYSGMPAFFVFAVVFTVLMLDRRLSIFFSLLELAVYIGCCLVAYTYPNTVTAILTEEDILVDTLVCFIAVSLSCGIVLYLHLREYNRQKEQLQLQKEVLMEIDRHKTEFLGNLSHELKTPLTVVSGYAQDSRSVIRSSDGQAALSAVDSNMKIITAEVDRLALMVSQLLDMTAIDEGRMELHRTLLSPIELVQDTLNTYYPMFASHGNTISFQREGKLSSLLCDGERIRQVLINLLSNAARHTRNGNITVTVSQGKDAVGFTVADDGDGISPEILPHIFDRYRRDESKTGDGRNTGTGLGLYIGKYIVEAHGGTIMAESGQGCGTTVRFTLPTRSGPLETDTSSPA